MDIGPWLETGGTGGIPTNYSQAKIELALFDLEKDIGESKDLKSDFPKVVKNLTMLGKQFDEKLKKTKRPAGKI